LQDIGLLAFDQLRSASFNSDPQISTTALFIMQSVRQLWVWPSDPFEVGEILENYATSSREDRAQLIERLSDLPDSVALAPLCRLARYETNEALSRLAVLTIMTGKADPSDPEGRIRNATIKQAIGDSVRETADWLRHYVDYRRTGELDADWWQEQLKSDRQLWTDNSTLVTRVSLVKLHKWLAVELKDSGQRDAAIATAGFLGEIYKDDFNKLLELCNWAVDEDLHEIVLDVANANRELFDTNPKHGYLEAEIFRKIGRVAEADQLATKILNRERFNAPPSMRERQITAGGLAERMMFDWAKNEYVRALDENPTPTASYVQVLIFYTTMLADGEEYSDAADAMQKIVEQAEESENFRRVLDAYRFDGSLTTSELLISRYYFYRTQDQILELEAAQKNPSDSPTTEQIASFEVARKSIQKAIDSDPYNSDLLIAAFEIPGDEAWDGVVKKALDKAEKEKLQQVDEAERAWNQVRNQPIAQATVAYQLGRACNEYSWLMCNTDRRLEDAVLKARRACEVRPNEAAYIDTLAAAYYQIGNLEEAVRMQRKAKELEPYTRQLLRTLEKYEREYEAQRKAGD
jgi:tetratricopeptide (TPR) repeat protein